MINRKSLYALGSGLLLVSAFRTLFRVWSALPQSLSLCGVTGPRFLLGIFPALMLAAVSLLLIPPERLPLPGRKIIPFLNEEQKAELCRVRREILFVAVFWMNLVLLFTLKVVTDALASGFRSGGGGWQKANALFLGILGLVYFFHYRRCLKKFAASVDQGASE